MKTLCSGVVAALLLISVARAEEVRVFTDADLKNMSNSNRQDIADRPAEMNASYLNKKGMSAEEDKRSREEGCEILRIYIPMAEAEGFVEVANKLKKELEKDCN